jgi:hypothetical protein
MIHRDQHTPVCIRINIEWLHFPTSYPEKSGPKVEEIMNERMERKLDEFMKRYIGFLQDRHLSQEIISIHCAEIRRYFTWWSEGGNPPFGSGLLTSLDFKAYINQIKKVNPQVANNRILPVLRSFLAFNQEINNYGDNLPGPIPNFLDNQEAKSWLDRETTAAIGGGNRSPAPDSFVQDCLVGQLDPVRSSGSGSPAYRDAFGGAQSIAPGRDPFRRLDWCGPSAWQSGTTHTLGRCSLRSIASMANYPTGGGGGLALAGGV